MASEVELPELPAVARGTPGLTVRMGPPSNFDASAFHAVFEYLGPDESSFCLCLRSGGDYLVDFPKFGCFLVSAEGEVSCMPLEGADWPLVRHLLVNWVLPRYLGSRGRLIVHAAAATLPDGVTVAFLGASGFGKSTLVSSFLRQGATLINDDCIEIASREGSIRTIGCYPGIRLYPDSIAALFGQMSAFAQYTPHTPKKQWLLSNTGEGHGQTWLPLNAMFLLNDPVRAPVDTVRAMTVPGPAAVVSLVRAAFSLDPLERVTMATVFRQTGSAIAEGIPVFELGYPRKHDVLDEVQRLVSDCLV